MTYAIPRTHVDVPPRHVGRLRLPHGKIVSRGTHGVPKIGTAV